MTKTRTISVKGNEITVSRKEQDDYISLTDIARYKNPNEPIDIIKNWLRSRTTIEFIGLWEQLHNPDFKAVEFDRFMYEAGSNSFVLSPGKWIVTTNAIGITTKSGRYGGTFAHQDIAFEFASWVSAEFKLYLLKEFQRLKHEEYDQKKLEWSVSRTIAKVNYLIHTDAIKENLIPPNLQKSKQKFIYADEADLLNLALFGQTALAWKIEHPELKGNMRDYATLEQLVVLSNLESLNAELIKIQMTAEERLQKLNKTAIDQMKVLILNKSMKVLRPAERKLSTGEKIVVEGRAIGEKP
ncbi:MAG: KilA-N domain-containing protein [Geobacteraceae bacterium]|nr:KilA-N domain-containing protein [Geobacteraceae bacterium]NTW80495.1 KilA-N domain-containing protein [Geobacteraceae bacterium]